MIEQLHTFDKNNLDDWYELSDSEQTDFLRKLAEYFKFNKSALSTYCNKNKPKEFSSLTLVYEAISIYSSKFNDFILEEIKRVIDLAKKKNITPNNIEILMDFEIEDIYEKDYSTYIKIIDFLINSLSNNQSDNLNIAILELLDFFLLESNDKDENNKLWKNKINNFIENSSENVKKHNLKNTENNILNKIGMKWQILFFIGLISQLIAITYFRKTIIETKISVGLYFVIGFIGLVAFNKKIQSYASSWFSKIIYSIVTFGGISIMLFLFLNFQFASKEIKTNKYKIIEKSSLNESKNNRSNRKLAVYIILNGIKKEIVYPHSKAEMVNNAKYLTIEKSKGLFGFDIIRNKKLE